MEDKYVIVTGASGNIGNKICFSLLKNNYNVIFTTRQKSLIEDVKRDFERIGSSARFTGEVLDLADKSSVDNFLKNIEEQYEISAFISNAAVDNTDSIESINDATLRHTMKVNFESPVLIISQLVHNWKLNNNKGKIIGISSLCAVMGDVNSGVYAASKAALEAYIRCAAVELGSYCISANTVRISAVGANLIKVNEKSRIINDNENKADRNTYDAKMIPSGHAVQIDALSKLILYLLQDDCNVTGQAINVDCGLSICYPKYKLQI